MPTAVMPPSTADTEAAALRWVRRKLGHVTHERRVRAIADRLFDLTRAALRLGEADRTLLRLTALTHDVGRSVSDRDHPALGAGLIETTTAVDLSPAVRKRLAFLARYHRGTPPRTVAVDRSLRAVLGLLRAADTLDHRHQPAERLVLAMDGGRLAVRVVVAGDLAHARRVYGRRKKYRLLESFLGHAVRVVIDGGG